MELEYLPGLVDVVHDGKLPTAQGWRDSLQVIDALVERLRAEISRIDDRMGADPRAASQLARDRKDLEGELRIATRKREMIDGALRAGLVRDAAQKTESASSASLAAGDQE
ncbi:MAG TPA: hypothetical protein VF688_00880 [Allosphingosinicella sp.]|jgi:hypothetical protein